MRLKRLWLAGCILLCVTAPHAQTLTCDFAVPVTCPGTAAVSFYQWYLDALDKHVVPTDDLRGPIRQKISLNLIHRLQRLLRNGDMEEDYFLKAQDFLPDWKTGIHAAHTQIRSLSATTEVTLGAGSSEHNLKVTLVLQDLRWKIDSISVIPGPSKSP